MADEYISLEMTVEETTITDEAIARLQDRWPTWEPNEADLEVVQLENVASMAAAVAETAASVPSTILQTLGLELFGVEPGLGSPAVGLLTITFIDTVGGYIVPAGSAFDVGGYAFETVNDVQSVPGNAVVADVSIQATEEGTEFNDIPAGPVDPISPLTVITAATLQAATTGGADPDEDEEYMARLLRELRLNGRCLTTLRNYEEFALSYEDVGRALALNNGPRAVAVFLLGSDGAVVSSARKAALLTEFDSAREVNTATTLFDPAFGVIDVSYAVVAYPGFDAADLIVRCNAKLAEMLDPLFWGRPKFIGDIQTELWINDTVVRRNKMIDALGDVEGVNYVYSLILSGVNEAGGAALTVSGRPQQDVLTKSGTLTAGSYKLQLDGIKTANTIAYNATGTQVMAALETLSNVEPGDIAISGDTFPLTITHTGSYHGRTRTLLVTDSALTGGSIAVTTPQTPVAGSGDVTLPLANGMVGLPKPDPTGFSGKVVG